ncbi:uncharacterized protein EV422DRAFT_506252 [Fimicolochytrium jonesii]|uniref:uncharacterized protein n=1 Tax=Fimicolochytrium jonesii TaxID=1396493 RepID=UPI0022FEF0E6|nr:uncharacterized protein EV422DRAFT_506252 [Fimicolochytrium jonesii]KAI8821032.1 hypothetical protein EV422DRAFT_506252 [Fimicolochytrium jonesii]
MIFTWRLFLLFLSFLLLRLVLSLSRFHFPQSSYLDISASQRNQDGSIDFAHSAIKRKRGELVTFPDASKRKVCERGYVHSPRLAAVEGAYPSIKIKLVCGGHSAEQGGSGDPTLTTSAPPQRYIGAPGNGSVAGYDSQLAARSLDRRDVRSWLVTVAGSSPHFSRTLVFYKLVGDNQTLRNKKSQKVFGMRDCCVTPTKTQDAVTPARGALIL